MNFLSTYFMTLVVLELFCFLGGFYLFDWTFGPYRAAAMISLVVAAAITAYMSQQEKNDELEKRVQELESQLEKLKKQP